MIKYEDLLSLYNPDSHPDVFKKRYAGLIQKKNIPHISKEVMSDIWEAFLIEKTQFLDAHKNIKEDDLIRIGIDKFILTMGWETPDDVKGWVNNKIRVGHCGHCKDQFVLMMFQYNYGLCDHCRPSFSSTAISQFLKNQTLSDRYMNSERDLLMDFFIMFYNDDVFRSLFLKSSDFSDNLEREYSFINPEDISYDLVEGEKGLYEVSEKTIKKGKDRTRKKTRR